MKLALDLPALPDIGRVGGNARRRLAWWEQREATKEEWEKWWYLIIEALQGQPRPRFSKAKAAVTLVFKEHRRRDLVDNVAMSLKPLWDVLVRMEILKDDSSFYLTGFNLSSEVDPGRAPLTKLVLEEDGRGDES